MFVHLNTLGDSDIEATSIDGVRYYYPPGASGPMPSITSVTSFYNRKVFAQWRKRVGEEEANKVTTVATRRGTDFHEVCEQYLMNIPLSEIDMLPTCLLYTSDAADE